MCSTAAILAGSAAAGTGLQIIGAVSKNGEKQAQYNQGQAYVTQASTTINQQLGQVYNSNAARANQENDAAATQSFDIVRAMAGAKGTAVASAGDAGVGGVSFSNILSDFEMREGLARGTEDYNYAAKTRQIADENIQARNRALSQVQSVVNSAPPPPSATSLWADIGSSAINGGLRIADAFGAFDKKKPEPQRTVTTPKAGATYGNEFEV